MGDITPISAQDFMIQMKEILKEERENKTNDQWRKTCSAKEFAKWLEEICFREQYNDGESMSGWYKKHDEKYWKKWLKQPHREE